MADVETEVIILEVSSDEECSETEIVVYFTDELESVDSNNITSTFVKMPTVEPVEYLKDKLRDQESKVHPEEELSEPKTDCCNIHYPVYRKETIGPVKAPFLCDTCGKQYASYDGFIYHMKMHKNIKNFKCSKCDMTFIKDNQRKVHLRTHYLADKEVICPHKLCNKKFFDSRCLGRHIRRCHLNIRNLICKVCGKCFIEKDKLNIHVSSMHSGPKKFSCGLCGKKYVQRALLKHHLQTMHSNNSKSFQCYCCKKSYTYKYTLLNHVKTIHDSERAFFCEICKCAFNLYTDFTKHTCISTAVR